MTFPDSLRALRHQNFRRFYLGQMVSQIGSWMQSVALMWLTYRLTGSPAATGTIGFLSTIPFLLMTPFAGALSDRMSRRKLLAGAQLALFGNAMALTLLTWFGHVNVALLGVFALIQGTVGAVEVTTRHSFFSQLIDDKADLSNAIALNSININGTRLVGPAIGGLVIAAFGEAVCFGINAVTYLAVVVQLARITPRVVAHVSTGKSFLGDLTDGWRLALGSPIILPLLLIVGLVSLTLNPYSILMPAIAVGTFGRGAELHGIFVSAIGIGALALGIVLARRPNVRGLGRWVLLTASAGAVGAILFALAAIYKNLPVAIFAMTLVGIGVMGTSACVNTIIQTVVDDDKRGRVVSVYSTFFTGAAPLGHLGVGWLAAHIGVPYAFLVCGCVCALGALAYALNLKRLRVHLSAAYTTHGIDEANK